MKEGRRERRAKQSHPFLIKAVAPNFVGLRDNPAEAHTLASSFATPQILSAAWNSCRLLSCTVWPLIITSLDSKHTLSSPVCRSAV